MEHIYLIFIIMLFLLAISDLIVGVSNDAVNFLNSAVGSKTAPLKIILLVAAIGVLAGTVFSGGMMEIARSGVFYPEKFTFSDMMLIFLAVMITDVILLDAFNSIGFPTSTTVSLIFELLGAAVAIAVFKIVTGGDAHLADYINSGKALTVVSGILVSVIIAFTMGALIQYLTRLIFTFHYEKGLRYLGGLFGGTAITIIVYFILIKGAKGAAFMTPENSAWVKEHSLQILAACFGGVTLLFYLLQTLFRTNILKIVVLIGTFALAMAFAGNDLVNFVGVPLAGYESYLTWVNSPGADPGTLTMEALNGAVKTPLIFLLMSGVVMVVTLYKSRKARTVIMTEVNLSRQDEGDERFGSSALSRSIVRISLGTSRLFSSILPGKTKTWVSKRFTPLPRKRKEKNPPAFDLLRASVNLVVSSALIALGTSLKLPLSTTYVTFMVAMGTSLSDGAWDRESAVYRITGVFSVIGGWFFTAISAFTLAFLLATLFFFGGVAVVLVMIAVAVFVAVRTHKIHVRKEEKQNKSRAEEEAVTAENLAEFCQTNTYEVLGKTSQYYHQILSGFEKTDLRKLKKTEEGISSLYKDVRNHRKNAVQMLKGSDWIDTEPAMNAINTHDNLLEILNCLKLIANASIKHHSNHHKPFTEMQFADFKTIDASLSEYLAGMKQKDDPAADPVLGAGVSRRMKTDAVIRTCNRNEVKRIQDGATGNRSNILFMSMLQETRNIVHFASQVMPNRPPQL
ncbi:MAG: inorganic phosphate transporter [Bacteroidales bacterium]